jgi:hypothetical protein
MMLKQNKLQPKTWIIFWLFTFAFFASSLFGQIEKENGTLYYREWSRADVSPPQTRSELLGKPHVGVTYKFDKVIAVVWYNAEDRIVKRERSFYDQNGNPKTRKVFDGNNQLVKEFQFRTNAGTLPELKFVFGENFVQIDRYFLVEIDYNSNGRELLFTIKEISGELICHRQTAYNEDGRKREEIFVNDTNNSIITRTKFKYDIEKNQTVVEEYDGDANLTSRVVLYGHDDFLTK